MVVLLFIGYLYGYRLSVNDSFKFTTSSKSRARMFCGRNPFREQCQPSTNIPNCRFFGTNDASRQTHYINYSLYWPVISPIPCHLHTTNGTRQLRTIYRQYHLDTSNCRYIKRIYSSLRALFSPGRDPVQTDRLASGKKSIRSTCTRQFMARYATHCR